MYHERTVVAARGAVRLGGGLAAGSSACVHPDLELSLNNDTIKLSGVGDLNEALVAAREAVELRRELAEASPAVYTPDLAARSVVLRFGK